MSLASRSRDTIRFILRLSSDTHIIVRDSFIVGDLSSTSFKSLRPDGSTLYTKASKCASSSMVSSSARQDRNRYCGC